MTEQMKQALKQEAENCKGDYTENNYSVDVGDVPFLIIEGVNWYLDNLWHDADKEQPEHRSTVIVGGKGYYEIIHNCSMVFQGRKWAYIEDILPK